MHRRAATPARANNASRHARPSSKETCCLRGDAPANDRERAKTVQGLRTRSSSKAPPRSSWWCAQASSGSHLEWCGLGDSESPRAASARRADTTEGCQARGRALSKPEGVVASWTSRVNPSRASRHARQLAARTRNRAHRCPRGDRNGTQRSERVWSLAPPAAPFPKRGAWCGGSAPTARSSTNAERASSSGRQRSR